jgi:hypothetical protein
MNCFYALRKYRLALVAISIMAMASMDALAADKAAKDVEDWEIRGEKGNVMLDTDYALYNRTSGKYVKSNYANMGETGLKWDDEHKPRTKPSPRFQFWKLSKKAPAGPLKFGDSVAITYAGETKTAKGPHLFLVYQEQEKGINLGWSRGGIEQWEIHGGPNGAPVPLNTKFSLYNKRAKDYVIYAEREHGINLRWNGDVHKPRDHRK